MSHSDEVLIGAYVRPDEVLFEVYSEHHPSNYDDREPIMDAIHDILDAIQAHHGNLFYIAEAAKGKR